MRTELFVTEFPGDAEDESGKTTGASDLEWLLYGGSALTVLALGTGAVASWQAHALHSDAEAAAARLDSLADDTGSARDVICGGLHSDQPPECSEIRTLEWRRSRWQTAATVGFVAAGGFAVATALSYALWPQSGGTTATRSVVVAPRLQAARVEPWLGPRGAGVALGARW